MKGYNKESITYHSDGCGRENHPAINIKVYGRFGDIDKITVKFKCTQSQSQKALDYAFNSAQRDFWENEVKELADKYFSGVKYYGAGRSDGWIEFYTDPETWDGQTLNRWAIMESKIKRAIKDYCTDEYIMDLIDSNKWYLEDAEEYNFIDFKDGTIRCIAEEKQKARKLLSDAGIVGIRI